MSERDEPDPFPEASIPETREGEVSPEALSAPRSDAPAVPPSEAPTLPLIPVDRFRFQTGDDAAPPAPPVSDSVSGAAPPPAREPAPSAHRDSAPPVEREGAPPVVATSPAAAPPPADPPSPSPASASVSASASASASASVSAPRDLLDRRAPLYRECQGYRLRLDPADLARLRELAGSRGRSDDEIGEAFFDGQADRFAESLAGDVPIPSEIRVIVDPYSRQAFLALENRIRGILSF